MNQRNSPLLRLPAELRNKIYLYVFDDNAVSLPQPHGIFARYPMGLAHSSTQCRYEALPHFWNNTVFHLFDDYMHRRVDVASQSMRDQIEVIHAGPRMSCNLKLGIGIHTGAFGGVQKVIMEHGHLSDDNIDAVIQRVKSMFGKDAELVDPRG